MKQSTAPEQPGRFSKQRTFTVGGVEKYAHITRAAKRFKMEDEVKTLLQNPWITMQGEAETLDTIVLTPRELGYTEPVAYMDLVYIPRLREWSIENTEELHGRRVERLPTDAILYVLEQYRDQPIGEHLTLATKRLAGFHGFMAKLEIVRVDSGAQHLIAYWSTNKVPPDAPVLFHLR